MLFNSGILRILCFCLCFEFHFSTEVTQRVKYDVLLKSTPIPENEKNSFQHLEMVSKYGQRFACQIPSTDNKTQPDFFPPLNNTYVRDLLSPLNQSKCLLYVKDWWTYELCYGRYVVQFHQEQGQRLSETILGYFDYETNWNDTFNFVNHSAKYHSQFYTNGTICDLTSNPRSAEVRYTCGTTASYQMVSVDETESCIYLIVVETPSLCVHPTFVVKIPPKVEEILCGVILDNATQLPNDTPSVTHNKQSTPLSDGKQTIPVIDAKKKSKRMYRLRKLYSVIRARRQKQLENAAVSAATHFREALMVDKTNQRESFSDHIGFIWRLYVRSLTSNKTRTSIKPFFTFVRSYELRMIGDHLSHVLFSLMDHLENLLVRFTPVFQIPSASLLYVSNLGEELAQALEMKVNESRGYDVPNEYSINRIQSALNSFQDLSKILINPDVSRLPARIPKFSGLKSFLEPAVVKNPSNAQSPIESELLHLLILGFRRHLLRIRNLAASVSEVEQLRATEAELESTFRDVLNRGKFSVLLVRGAISHKQPKVVRDPLIPKSEKQSRTDSKPMDPVLDLLKKVLHKVVPGAANELEIYETPGLVDGYSTFYLMANEDKANEERRIAEQEKAYRFGHGEKAEN